LAIRSATRFRNALSSRTRTNFLCARAVPACTSARCSAFSFISCAADSASSLRPRCWLSWVCFSAFALDGLNSFAQAAIPLSTPYQTTNLLRLITGFGAGICIGAVLAPVFNQSVWSNSKPGAALESLPHLLGLLGAAALLGWAVYSGPEWLKAVLAVLSALAVPLVLTLAYTVLGVMLLGRANQYKNWRELRVPLALGLCAALAQILLLDILRLLLTGTWAALKL